MAIKDRSAEITAQFVQAIENGLADGKWVRPWNSMGDMPFNPVTKKDYHGSNWFMLLLSGGGHWATYNQWADIGAQVRKGEKGVLVCRPVSFTKENDDGTKDRVFTGKFAYYNVFSASQVDGYVVPDIHTLDFEPIAAIESDMNTLGVPVSHGGSRAFYAPSRDSIQMPHPETFHSVTDYYATLLHEGAHSTGHKSRLDRELMTPRFGSEAYAFEELVAELASTYMAVHYGIQQSEEIDTNHIKYVKSWLEVLKNDSTAIMKAASLAEAAASYITEQKTTKKENDLAEAA